jgi:DNA-binding CsgD family transcriptional regulator
MLLQYGVTEQMSKEASQLGVNHSFTMVKKHEKSCDYYHFATHSNQDGFIQVYLSNLDVLDRFIEYFHEKIRQSKMLLIAYDYTFEHKQEISKPSLQDLDKFLSLEQKASEVKNELGSETKQPLVRSVIHKESGKILTLASQQARCLALLLSGKSSKEIGLALNLSYPSVEHYIERIRKILDCRNSKEVLAQYSIFCGTQSVNEGGR